MFPTDFIEESTETTAEEVGNDFLFDYTTGQHIISNSLLTECTEVESVRQFIQNVLRTKANAYKVYTTEETDIFGISVYDYLGQRTLPMGYINSELKREVTEQLLNHPYISSVSNWVGKREKRGLEVSFTVALSDGIIIEETQIVGG